MLGNKASNDQMSTMSSQVTSFLCLQVRLHLLTAIMKCFLRRPPETQKALGAALAAGLADFHQVWLVCMIFWKVERSGFEVFTRLSLGFCEE